MRKRVIEKENNRERDGMKQRRYRDGMKHKTINRLPINSDVAR